MLTRSQAYGGDVRFDFNVGFSQLLLANVSVKLGTRDIFRDGVPFNPDTRVH